MASTTPDPTEPDTTTWSPEPDSDGALDKTSAIHQAIGAASVCWENLEGTGTFQDDQASAIAKGLEAWLDQHAMDGRFTPAECQGTKGGCQRWSYGDILHRHWTDTSTGMDVITPGDTPPGQTPA